MIAEPKPNAIFRDGRIVISGTALANTPVTVQINKEPEGQPVQLDLQAITTTANSTGQFMVILNGIYSGVRQLSVSCNGVVSDLVPVLGVAPSGIIFSSNILTILYFNYFGLS
jgi:hypothetical protein